MKRQTTGGACLPCGAALRSRTQYLCRDCVKAGSRAFARRYPFTDADQHQRNLNAWNSDFVARVAAIRAERGLVGAA